MSLSPYDCPSGGPCSGPPQNNINDMIVALLEFKGLCAPIDRAFVWGTVLLTFKTLFTSIDLVCYVSMSREIWVLQTEKTFENLKTATNLRRFLW